jgi:hypothetical protein
VLVYGKRVCELHVNMTSLRACVEASATKRVAVSQFPTHVLVFLSNLSLQEFNLGGPRSTPVRRYLHDTAAPWKYVNLSTGAG